MPPVEAETVTRASGGLEGQAFLITGGGTGIGRACAAALAADGAAVTICGRTAERLEDAAQRIEAAAQFGGSVQAVVADVTDEASVEAAIAKVWTTEAAQINSREAIQMHGATGVSQWTPLAGMYTSQRTLRLADGPDEVHHHLVARAEVASYKASNARQEASKPPRPGQIFTGP